MVKNYLLALCLMPTILLATSSMNELTKVFHHKGPLGDKLVCYFVNEPICNRVPVKKNEKLLMTREELQFFMPMTIENPDAKTMINKLQGARNPFYSFVFQEVDKPLKGIKLTIVYDPKKVVCNYEVFDAISTNKGLVFSFHNKEILQQLKQKTDGLLQYALHVPKKKLKIMLDFGHGGTDDGKVGKNIKEKDLNLIVGTKVARLLTGKGYEICCTRKSDRFVALDERTYYANQHRADLFLSIHANAAQKSEVQGIETYWMNDTLFKPGMTLTDGTIQTVLQSLKQEHSKQSQLLAQFVHEQVLQATKKMHKTTDRKVKQSVAQVLLGTEMPSALIEIGFLSNPEETKLLTDHTYQELIAQGIAAGIIAYLTLRNNA